MNTSTGSGALASAAGAHTLRYRQSSEPPSSAPAVEISTQLGPHAMVSRTPSHAGIGCGGLQRRSPTGGAAYGTPRHATTSPSRTPRTYPASVATIAGPDGG